MSVVNYPRRTGRLIIISFSILFVIFFILLFVVLGTTGLGLATNFLIGILILLIILPVIGFAINRIAGPSPKKCPRCNYPVGDYAEYCKNCGFDLLVRCPNCNRLQRTEYINCKKCEYCIIRACTRNTHL